MGDRIEALERLAALRDKGALSQAEFEAEKQRLLGGGDRLEPPPVFAEPEPEPAPRRGWAIAAAIGALAVLLIGVAYVIRIVSAVPEPVTPRTAHRPAPSPSAAAVDQAPEPPPAVSVASVFRVDVSDGCRFGEAGEALFDRLLRYRDDGVATAPPTVTIAGVVVPTAFRTEKLGDATRYVATALAPAGTALSWNGLHFAGIYADTAYAGESRERELLFTDSPAAVRAALAAHGVAVPLPPGTRELQSDVSESIRLDRRDGRTAIACVLDV